METETTELLRRYVATGCEDSLRRLVESYANLVFSTALRRLAGDKELAKDVSQRVFCDLACKAGSLPGDVVLAGWLHKHTCLKTSEAVRSEQRRRVRERTSFEMSIDASNETLWRELAPILDEELARLGSSDRDALLLRFCQGEKLSVVARTLGISEDAAQKRVSRALARLRAQLEAQEITCTADALSNSLSLAATPLLPIGLAAAWSSVAVSATAGTVAAATWKTTILHIMASMKVKIASIALLVAALGTPFVLQHRAVERMKIENESLRERLVAMEARPSPPPQSDPDESSIRQREKEELARLRGQVGQLRRERDDLIRKTAATVPTNRVSRLPSGDKMLVDERWMKDLLDGPLVQRGMAAGALRGKFLQGRMKEITASEIALQDGILAQNLNQTLERSPADFADFQSAFIQSMLGIEEADKAGQIRQIIQNTYEQAVAQGLDIPSKPATEADDWVQRRHQLDRRATEAVQQLLTEDEREDFNRAFLGVMGVDLGGRGVDKSNYPSGFLH